MSFVLRYVFEYSIIGIIIKDKGSIMQKIITHSGKFHPDELMAISLLAKFHFRKGLGDLEIIRTRNPKELSEYKKDPSVFVLDVGREFESEMLNFDHHQEDSRLIWKDQPNIPKSACGLIFDWLLEKGDLSSLSHRALDTLKDTAKKIDSSDNGIGDWEFFNIFDLLNYGEDENSQFLIALKTMSELLNSIISKSNTLEQHEYAVDQAIQESVTNGHPEVVVIRQKMMNCAQIVARKSSEALYAISGDSDEVLLESVPVSAGLFQSRKVLPKYWLAFETAGSEVRETIPELTFCHKLRFVAAFKSDVDRVFQIVRNIK